MHREELTEFIRDYLCTLLDIPAAQMDVDLPFERYGLDSTAAAGLSGELSEKLGIELSANVAYDHPTIASMTDYVLSLAPARP